MKKNTPQMLAMKLVNNVFPNNMGNCLPTKGRKVFVECWGSSMRGGVQ